MSNEIKSGGRVEERLAGIEERLARIEALLEGRAVRGSDVMRLSELVDAGYGKSELMRIYRMEKGVAWKGGNKANSLIYFDVPKLKKLLEAKSAPGRRRW